MKLLCNLQSFKKIKGLVTRSEEETLKPLKSFNYMVNSKTEKDLEFIEMVLKYVT